MSKIWTCCVGHGSFPGALYGGHCSLQGLSLGLEALAVVVALTLQPDNGCGVGMMFYDVLARIHKIQELLPLSDLQCTHM